VEQALVRFEDLGGRTGKMIGVETLGRRGQQWRAQHLSRRVGPNGTDRQPNV
jgi:hypothetical protein